MAEQVAFSCHNNPSSHIPYIRAGNNSDFAFQKAVSGAPMPKKKQLLQKYSMREKILKRAAKKDYTKKTPKYTTHMKAPPSSKQPIRVATLAATAAVR
jgi:hypothetical protein